MNRRYQHQHGTTLFVAVLTIAVCSLLVGVYLRSVVMKFRAAHQGASWREALQGAEAGINHGISELNDIAQANRDTGNYPWAERGWSLTDALFSLNGERLLDIALLPILGGGNDIRTTRLSVDVYTRETEAPYHPWYRIRATGRANLPDGYVAGDRAEVRLRRLKLGAKSGGKPAPYVTRTVEVIVKPRLRFPRAITTVNDLTLANSSGWVVDSFDSSNPDMSDAGTAAGGVYPSDASQRGSQGNIASARTLPENTPYGELITGNGAKVDGTVQTAGGDNPNTTTYENVSGSSNMDPTRIRSDFDEAIPAPPQGSWRVILPTPLNKTNFLTGTSALPARYAVADLGAFQVTPPLPGTTGYIEILVNGDLNIGNGGKAEIVIPPNVKATIYVKGNIDFGNGEVNSGEGSSKVAANLSVFGLSTNPAATYKASGNAEQTLTFYGPNYAMNLAGTVKTSGAIVAKSFSISGGGNGGFHYDEALGRVGDIVGWAVASYFEDSRGE